MSDNNATASTDNPSVLLVSLEDTIPASFSGEDDFGYLVAKTLHEDDLVKYWVHLLSTLVKSSEVKLLDEDAKKTLRMAIFDESQIAIQLDDLEETVVNLEASEHEFRSKVEVLEKLARDYQTEVKQRIGTLKAAQKKLAERATVVDEYAGNLCMELQRFNEMIRAGEERLSKLLNDLLTAKEQGLNQV